MTETPAPSMRTQITDLRAWLEEQCSDAIRKANDESLTRRKRDYACGQRDAYHHAIQGYDQASPRTTSARPPQRSRVHDDS